MTPCSMDTRAARDTRVATYRHTVTYIRVCSSHFRVATCGIRTSQRSGGIPLVLRKSVLYEYAIYRHVPLAGMRGLARGARDSLTWREISAAPPQRIARS